MFGVEGKCIQVLEGKPKGKRPLGIPRPNLECNIEVGLKGIRWDGVDWVYVGHGRDSSQALVNMVTNLWVP